MPSAPRGPFDRNSLKWKTLLLASCALSLCAGFLLGAAAIHRPIGDQPWQPPPLRKPWVPADAAGLVGSAGIRALAGHLTLLPKVILETDKSFGLEVSGPKTHAHYVIVPKKDIRDSGRITQDDGSYLTDIFLTARVLVERENLRAYRIYTTGAGLQSVGYLHFHLVGRREVAPSRPDHL